MAKSTITRERIQRIIRAIDSEAYDEEEIREWLSSDEIMELSRIALAAMDSEGEYLPLDYLQGHKDGLEWAAQLAEANHPETGDWLYDDPNELAKAIRKGPDMPELKSVPADEDDNFYSWFGRFWSENYQKNNYTTSAKQMLGTMAEFAYRAGRESAALAGNSPAIPDIWIPVSERMPEDEQEVLTINRMGHRFVSLFDKHSGLFFDRLDAPSACCIEHVLVTHWMPLPAAPQEVK
ncbi:DUF551 domain-containing protein [Klebsiella aerogenes]|uniref:DUF551 domain-containing protein n=1 Tax=Klebsiella aerogenes TaxID=548 RepID=UPI003F55D0B4